MAHPQYKILILDGTPNGQELGAALHRNIIAQVIKADSVSSMASMARAFNPDIAILAADHPEREKELAEKLLRELNAEIAVLRL